MADPNIVTLTQDNFKAEVIDSPTPVLVDFWAEWCNPCRALGPILDELAQEYGGRVKIGKVNIENDQALAAQYNVNSIPTLLFFHQGEVTEQIMGLRSKRDLKASLDRVAA
jgi:thioredoxin 1